MARYVMTGGATGIGAEIKQHLLAQGHTLTVLDLRDADICVDLSDREATAKAIEDVLADTTPIAGIITCAGVPTHFPDKRKLLEINYLGTLDIINGLSASLSSGARIVAISSNSAPMCAKPDVVDKLLNNDWDGIDAMLDELNGHDCYSGSKQAVARWMRRQAPELARRGINFNAIAPGYIETPMTAAVANDAQWGDAIRKFVASIPCGRPGQPKDIADAVDFLLSPESAFVVGSLLYVDGGHDAMFRPESI
ncbi:MAG: hypothetical protein RL336_1996 [Pseudomonadota bacterium]|jgi:NAD(P)-dependent dehydrogenase (short-subunit alcohol dehydrogenase family)